MENPLVTIIVITYNSAKYVLETLESANAQTYQNIELIISDDCSTDNTLAVCRNWIKVNERRFCRVKVVNSKENTGVAANCNRGITAATGEWIRLIAGDDLLKENCIEYSIKKVKSLSRDCKVFRTRHIHFVEKNLKKEFLFIKEKKSVFYDPKISSKQQLVLALRNINPSMTTFLIKKEVFNLVGGFDERFKLFEDRPFLIRLLINGFKIYCDQEITGFHRVRIDSIFNSGKNKFIVTGWTFNYFLPVMKTYYQPFLSIPEKIMNKYFFFLNEFFYYNLNENKIGNYLLYKTLSFPYFLSKKLFRLIFKIKIKAQLKILKN